LPKTLREDLEWAAGVISANKLYQGNLSNINFDERRPEIKAWLEMISMKHVPVNIEEMQHRSEYEALHKADNQKFKKRPTERKKEDNGGDLEGDKKKYDPESSQAALLAWKEKSVTSAQVAPINQAAKPKNMLGKSMRN
jgi:hypothetical protein